MKLQTNRKLLSRLKLTFLNNLLVWDVTFDWLVSLTTHWIIQQDSGSESLTSKNKLASYMPHPMPQPTATLLSIQPLPSSPQITSGFWFLRFFSPKVKLSVLYLIQTVCCTRDISFVISTNSLKDMQSDKKGQLTPTTTLSEKWTQAN